MEIEKMLKGFRKVIPPGNSFIPSGKRFLIGILVAVPLLSLSCDNQEQRPEKPTTEIDGLKIRIRVEMRFELQAAHVSRDHVHPVHHDEHANRLRWFGHGNVRTYNSRCYSLV